MRATVATTAFLAVLVTSVAMSAQQPAPAGVDPIRCWWQASAGAITIGEAFSVSLTCAVLDTQSVQVVPDESRLGVAAVQLAPFEIIGGDHPPDSRSGARRFFQYHYSLRTLDRDMIGHDVKIPQLNLSYRVHSRVGADAALEGRDLTYILPPISLRVLSLVPAEAPDIRDGGEASLGAVAALRFRAGLFEILAGMFGLLAVIAVVLALMPIARGARQVAAHDHSRMPDRLVLNRAAAELTDVQTVTARDGWSDPLVIRTLSALRLVAAFAISHAVSQKVVSPGGVTPDGRLLVQRGWPNALQSAVSSSVTPDDVDRAIAALPAAATVTARQELVGLRDGLRAFTAAVYPQTPVRDVVLLDDALKHGLAMSHQLSRR
jgi:RES domain-containing protein